MTERTQYYALCVTNEDGEGEIAFLDLGKNELGQVRGWPSTPHTTARRSGST